jgi:hypothetical protein
VVGYAKAIVEWYQSNWDRVNSIREHLVAKFQIKPSDDDFEFELNNLCYQKADIEGIRDLCGTVQHYLRSLRKTKGLFRYMMLALEKAVYRSPELTEEIKVFELQYQVKGQRDVGDTEGDITNMEFVCRETIKVPERRLRTSGSGLNSHNQSSVFNSSSINRNNSARPRSPHQGQRSVNINTVQSAASSVSNPIISSSVLLNGFNISMTEEAAKGKEFKIIEGEKCKLCGLDKHNQFSCTLATANGKLSLPSLVILRSQNPSMFNHRMVGIFQKAEERFRSGSK